MKIIWVKYGVHSKNPWKSKIIWKSAALFFRCLRTFLVIRTGPVELGGKGGTQRQAISRAQSKTLLHLRVWNHIFFYSFLSSPSACWTSGDSKNRDCRMKMEEIDLCNFGVTWCYLLLMNFLMNFFDEFFWRKFWRIFWWMFWRFFFCKNLRLLITKKLNKKCATETQFFLVFSIKVA